MKIKDLLKQKGISFESFRWMMKLISPYKWQIICMILLRCILSAVGVGSAVVNKYLVDYAQRYLNVTGMIALTVACSCITLLGNAFLSVYSSRMTERLSYYIRKTSYEHILRSSWRERTQLHSGEILSRMTSDVNRIADGVMNATAGLVSTVVQFGLAVVLLWNYDQMLTKVALLSAPVIALFSFFLGRRLKRIQVQLQQTEADYRVFLQEQLTHADVLKAFQQEQESLNKLDWIQARRMALVIKSNRCTVLMRCGVGGFFSGSYLFAFITGALKIASGAITYGTMTAFLSLVNQVQSPVLSMTRLSSQMIGLMASASRVMEIAGLPKELPAEESVPSREPVGITASDLTFSYGETNQVIQKLSFQIAPGTIAAVMGSSGAGKTTLIRMMLGFLKPDAGEIHFTEQENQIPCSEKTRSLISYVPQGNTLFRGTIADNLRIGKQDATQQEMWEVLEMACAAEFVKQLPEGLETRVEEKGHGFSEGQAQRIAIARAFLRRAPVLILDEATSALDEKTELEILQHLENKRSERTCIVISHRNVVTDFADQIIEI